MAEISYSRVNPHYSGVISAMKGAHPRCGLVQPMWGSLCALVWIGQVPNPIS